MQQTKQHFSRTRLEPKGLVERWSCAYSREGYGGAYLTSGVNFIHMK